MKKNIFSFALEIYLEEKGLSQERKNIILSCMNDDINNVRDLIESIEAQYSDRKGSLKYLNIPEIINKILPEFENVQAEVNIPKSEIEVLREDNQ